MSAADDEARRYLRWFPGWMRADRGEEAVGLVLDLLPPGAEHLPLRARVDLVRAGLHARRVGIPPARVWWGVVAARPKGRPRPVPPAWRPWLAAWLRSPRWRFRYAATCAGPVALLVAVMAVVAWREGRLDTIFSPAWSVLFGGWSGWRTAGAWRTTISVANGLDPVTLGELPSDERRPVVLEPQLADGPIVARLDAALAWCAVVVVGSAILWPAGWPRSLSWGPGPAIAGVLASVPGVALGAAMVVSRAKVLAARPAPGRPADAPLSWARSSRRERVAKRSLVALVLAAATASFGSFAAGAAVAVGVGVLLIRRSLRRTERATGHPITVWGLFPWAAPAVRWIEPALDDRPDGPAPA